MAFETHETGGTIPEYNPPEEVKRIKLFRTYKAHLAIFGESGDGPWEKIVGIDIEGPADIVAQTISWAADAFKEHEER